MASTKAYLDFILEQTDSPELTYRAMMGEYVLYYEGNVVGGVYDDRLLIKPSAGARALLPQAREELPYPGAKPMLLVDEVDRRGFLQELFRTVADELPRRK
ncbi:MAG: TfoX/Sxy family protein [Oscillospiraceae bacterium]|nr:TfoX/Sxy family protein [Oscillospiraceae bacterium]